MSHKVLFQLRGFCFAVGIVLWMNVILNTFQDNERILDVAVTGIFGAASFLLGLWVHRRIPKYILHQYGEDQHRRIRERRWMYLFVFLLMVVVFFGIIPRT